MSSEWREESLTREPLEFEQLNNEQYIQRRNIVKVHHPEEDGMPTYDEWQCESRVIFEKEYYQTAISGLTEENERLSTEVEGLGDAILEMSEILYA